MHYHPRTGLAFPAVAVLAALWLPLPAASPTAGDTAFAALMEQSMKSMETGMRRAPMNGDPDHDFASMMIAHHQGAIDMARAELLYGKNPVLRRLAQEIIVTQGSEIGVLRSALEKRSPPPRPHLPSNR
ncbi:MAG: DUF305 domain-containing protein [Massilia sp.]